MTHIFDTRSDGQKITPLAYQEAATEGVEAAFAEGHQRVIVQMPTGTGKTVLYLFLAKRRRCYGKTLVVVHRKELIDQPIEKLPLIWPEAQYGVVRGAQDGWYARDIVFASVQTLQRPDRLACIKADFDMIVVDEAHRACADGHQAVLRRWPKAKVVGPTATPGRADKKTLQEAGFTAFAYRMGIDDAIRYDYLAPYVVERHAISGLDLRGVKEKDGDLDREEVARRAKEGRVVARGAARIYVERAGGQRAVIFTPDAIVAEQTAEELRALGVCADWLSDKHKDVDRERILRDFKAGRIMVLANYGILTEGYDDPSLACVIFARFTRSKGLYIQCIGRVLRKFLNKIALILDCAPNWETHGLCYAGSLTKPQTAKEKDEEAEMLPVFGEFSPGPSDVERAPANPSRTLLENTAGGVLEFGAGRRAVAEKRVSWIDCAPGVFAIPLRDEDHIVLCERDGLWVARSGHEEIVAHADMAMVQGIAEQRARELGALSLSKDDAIWRSRPASDSQVGRMRSRECFFVEGITQGQAADVLTASIVRERYARN